MPVWEGTQTNLISILNDKNRLDARSNIVTIIIEAIKCIENTLGICDNIYGFKIENGR